MGLLSVIIINYNTFELTCKCIDSIYKYTRQVSFEVILVDNASTECDPSLFLNKFPDVKLIPNTINAGFAAGNNLGIKNSTGDVILLLNNDTELIEDSLSICYNYLKNTSYPIVLTCKLVYPLTHNLQYQCNRFPSILLNFLELSRLHKLLSKKQRGRLLLSTYFNHEELTEPDWIWGTFFMFPSALLNSMPGQKLDEIFFMYCEDIKWCYDFAKLNIKRVYLPATKVIHHVGSSSSNTAKSNFIIKHELEFVRITRGRVYQLIYTIVKAANLYSTLNTWGKKEALLLLKNI